MDQQIERNYHPENYEYEVMCPECGDTMMRVSAELVCACGYTVTTN